MTLQEQQKREDKKRVEGGRQVKQNLYLIFLCRLYETCISTILLYAY
jgi:hypothetical protein